MRKTIRWNDKRKHLTAMAWCYALLIGASRVIVTAHFASDVMARAVVGIVGSLLVQKYLADRRLAFSVRSDGEIQALSGPSFQRLRKAVGSLLTDCKPERSSS